MPDLATLKGYLARAETHITEGELRLARQIINVDHLHVERRDSWQAQIILEEMQGTLAMWRVHRAELLTSIARLEAANTF